VLRSHVQPLHQIHERRPRRCGHGRGLTRLPARLTSAAPIAQRMRRLGPAWRREGLGFRGQATSAARWRASRWSATRAGRATTDGRRGPALLASRSVPDGILDLLCELVESALEFLGLALAAKPVVAGGLAGGLLCPTLGLLGLVLDASNNALDPGVHGHVLRPPRVVGFEATSGSNRRPARPTRPWDETRHGGDQRQGREAHPAHPLARNVSPGAATAGTVKRSFDRPPRPARRSSGHTPVGVGSKTLPGSVSWASMRPGRTR
jgi:hypothetical protein